MKDSHNERHFILDDHGPSALLQIIELLSKFNKQCNSDFHVDSQFVFRGFSIYGDNFENAKKGIEMLMKTRNLEHTLTGTL